ncbi:MAG: DUF2207 domain-containing protein [Candidatus Magasanikbacteria bacterium]|nr:DUF2207 domain-containing protein [Candidatus Magasanikbacteria bacterium]
MKKIFRWLIPLAFCFFLTIGSDVSAQTASFEKIEKFYTDIAFTKNDTVKISETIEYDFGTNNRHGIYRTIPTKYWINRFPYNIRLYDIDVTDKNNNKYPFTINHTAEGLDIRVGNPNAFVSGKKTYVFKYTIQRVWLYQNSQDLFYWNSTGNEWSVPINEARTTIHLPQKLNTSNLQAFCTEGSRDSSKKCNYQNLNENNGETSKIEFAQNNLKPYQGTTILIGLPKNVIKPPTLLSTVLWAIRDNWILTIPVFILIIMFIIWYKKGRDPKGSPIIIPEYDAPDKLTPAEIGTIVDMKITSKELTAQIISLAVRGYLKIERIEADGKNVLVNDFKLIRTEKTADDLQFWEQALLTSLFSGTNDILLSQLKYNFQKDFTNLQRNVYKSLTERGYFTKNPQYYTQAALIIVIFSSFVLYILIKSGVIIQFWQHILALFLSMAIFSVFLNAMSKRTEKGVKAKEHILGLKEYLTVAEKDRIEFHNAPEKNIEKYEELLPFAIALGVESQWAKYFSDLTLSEYRPNWYLNTRTHNLFTALSFTNEINSFRTITTNNLLATKNSSGSGGGGRSGRGFGGGGGGSW